MRVHLDYFQLQEQRELFGIKGDLGYEPFTFNMIGNTPMAINQDWIAELQVPLFRQRIRVITSAGTPVAGATFYGGVGQNGLPTMSPMSPIEGLGNFNGNWLVQSISTDSNGYVNMPALSMAKPTLARFVVGVPSSYKYSSQTFDINVGAGEQVVTLTKPIPMLSGTVKDSVGKAVDNAVVSFSDGISGSGIGTNSAGKYSISLAPNNNYRVSLGYKDGAYANNFMMNTWTDSANFAISADSTLDITIPFNKTRVKVIDGTGTPVAGAFVSIKPKPSASTDYTGAMTIFPGKKALNTYFYSTATTDSTGYATLTTLKLDSLIDGNIFASYGQSPNVNWVSSVQKIGAGNEIIVTVLSSNVTLSGKLSTSDGSALPDNFNLSFSDGKGNSAQILRKSNGTFTGTGLRGITGQWWLGCGRVDLNLASDFCASLTGGPSITLNSDLVQDIVVPLYKTSVQVVNADGKAIPKVKVLINTQMKAYGKTTLFPGKTPFISYFLSSATTDQNGIALLTSLKMDNSQLAYLELTPDPASRYQSRGLSITVGDNSKNVIVLQIPKPVILSIVISSVNGVRTATVNGDNLLGVFSVTAGTFSFDDFTNKNGAITTQGFKVINNNQIQFPIPAGLGQAVVTIKNGGGVATSQTFNFSP